MLGQFKLYYISDKILICLGLLVSLPYNMNFVERPSTKYNVFILSMIYYYTFNLPHLFFLSYTFS